MNRIILAMPKSFLENYVGKHFSEFSVDDFFQIVKRIEIRSIRIEQNDTLRKSSKVLSYMLDIDPYCFEYFDVEAFSSECVNKIADSGVEISPFSHPEAVPVLLENPKIFQRMLSDYAFAVVKILDGSQITSDVISMLEKNEWYVPDEEDLDKSPLFFESKELMSRAITNNPRLILKMEKPSSNLVSVALKQGFIPKKEDFLANPYLRTKDALEKSFEQDPSVIVFFKPFQFSEWIVRSARERGFLASEKDLIEYPNLRDCQHIMEDAISANPALIVYVNRRYVRLDILKEALSKYKVTKEDFEKHPEMAENRILMQLLPEFSLYDADLAYDKKVRAFATALKTSSILTTDDLPFLDAKFGGKYNVDDMNELLKYLNVPIDENNKNLQQKYLQILNKIVDASATMRYTQGKNLFKYPNIVVLNDSLVQLFKNVLSTDNHGLISVYVRELYDFVGGSVSLEKLNEYVEKYYNIYVTDGSIDLSITSDFCNMILNEHMNYFINNERNKILHDLESEMRLTKKREDTILNRKRIKKVEEFIRTKQYEQLGTTEERFLIDIDNVINAIFNNKFVRKKEIQEYKLKLVADRFITQGKIDRTFVSKTLEIDDDSVSNFIVQKFEQIKVKYLGKISLTEQELVISASERGGLHQANYIIGDDDRRLKNLSEVLVNLDDKLLSKALSNKEYFNEVSFLLPFVGLVQELNVNIFIKILINYDKIRDKLTSALNLSENVNFTNIILNNLDYVIFLANGYGSVDDITLFALGENIVSEVGEHDSSKYLDFYVQVLGRKNGIIPPISLETGDYHLESGVYADPDRLLIGKKPDRDSCIDLGEAGTKTYTGVLLEDSGDVILVRDNKGNLVSRILIFRRGNVVRMAIGRACFIRSLFTPDLFKKIADQIIEQAISNGDNIEYVFVSCMSFVFDSCSKAYPLIKDSSFSYDFPHIDIQDTGYLLSSKKSVQGYEEGLLELDFEVEPLISYEKVRQSISYSPTEGEIARLRALKIVLESDSELRENMARDFELFYSKEYTKVACGEDWYIAVKKDGTIEHLELSLDDPRILQEMEEASLTLGIEFEIPSKGEISHL